MAGLYIHIPFCARRCLYCDFYSQTELHLRSAYVDAILSELERERDYLEGEPVRTIYIGGGTPSLLAAADLERMFDTIRRQYDISSCSEITLEANPDDMTAAYAQSLRPLPVNRISMGVQSFHPADLRFLNRRHTREQAIDAVEACRNNGITNISIDLIYGLPGQTETQWEDNLRQALALDTPHISAYHLIYEEGTTLYRLWQSGQVAEVSEEVSVSLFARLIDRLTEAGYQQYEISNFARPGYISQHNSAYWRGDKYLGIGASAHSYNGRERKWNVSSLPAYLKGIHEGQPVAEKEQLTLQEQYNDYIITRLRTMWGIPSDEINRLFGTAFHTYFEKQIQRSVKKSLVEEENGCFRLTRAGIFVSDGVMSDLLKV